MGLGYLTGVLGGHPCKSAWIGLIRLAKTVLDSVGDSTCQMGASVQDLDSKIHLAL